jgi:hypothetical protein
MRFALSLAMIVASVRFAAAQARSISDLLAEGWEVGGYTSGFDNRSSVILFRHKDKTFLVQCSTLYDVTRNPRVTVNCYELH